MQTQSLKRYIQPVDDFPADGIRFRDITPLLADPQMFDACCNSFASAINSIQCDALVAIESRGFIFAAPLARQLGLPLILVRKPGKLPGKTVDVRYALEYGEDQLSVHADDIQSGNNYIIIDDVLATGGTAAAAVQLIEKAGGDVAGLVFLMELLGLPGRDSLPGRQVIALLEYTFDE